MDASINTLSRTAGNRIWSKALAACAGLLMSQALWAVPPSIPLSNVPLTVAQPPHPQVLLAVGNSESMDGNLSGAIMTGSGSLSNSNSLLTSSSSPTCYTIPSGFTPPLSGSGTGGCSAGSAPYTVQSNGTLYDNSPSRLNVAKAGISAILSSYMASTDFALEDYSTGNPSLYSTWVYHMSPDSGFVFTSSKTAKNNYVPNPCQGVSTLSNTSTIYIDCQAIATAVGQTLTSVSNAAFVQVANTSDDPLINDVLYASGDIDPICMVYGAVNPATPYPPNKSLSDYNNGKILLTYQTGVPGPPIYPYVRCATTTGPTNAGYVPYSTQTMYALRGWAYGASQSPNSGNIAVGMTTAGQSPTTATINNAIANFTPWLNPETNSTSSSEMKASAGQSAISGLMAGALSYYKTQNPPSSNGCPANRYVVLLTDGLPTLDASGKAWPPPGTVSATNYGMTVTFNSDGSLDSSHTNDQALTDTITSLSSLNAAGIKVYIIGLGAGVDSTNNPTAAQVLTAMAIAGGTGDYFPATSPTALTNDLQVIIQNIQATVQSTSSGAADSTALNNGTDYYQATFNTSDTYQDWTGNLFDYGITNQVVNSTPKWAAQSLLDSRNWQAGNTSNNRAIATWDPLLTNSVNGSLGAGEVFEWSNTPALFGINPITNLGKALVPNASQLASSTTVTSVSAQDVLNYIRGNTALEQRKGGVFRSRAHLLGDIVDSNPLYVGPPAGAYVSSSYYAFEAANANRTPMIYIGGNDGMVHAFNANTGAEWYAYIPTGVFNNLVNLSYPLYNQQHRYFVNGSPTAADTQFSDGSWHTVVIGGENAGGQTLYAIDVTNLNGNTPPSEATLASSVMWEFSDPNLGYTYSRPVSTLANAGYLTFFGNGYDSTPGTPYLYALNTQTGSKVARIDLCGAVPTACDLNSANGLSTVAVVSSGGNLAGPMDLLYAGDLQGNLWRVNISDANPANWTVTVLFKATYSGKAQPITAAPAVSLNPKFPSIPGMMVYIGTGQLLGTPDLTTTAIQSVYGIYDNLGTYSSPVSRSTLVQQTEQYATVDGKSVITSTSNAVNLPSVNGWYIDLTLLSSGRVIADPQLDDVGGLVFVVYAPNANSCAGGGSSLLMDVNYATGGGFPEPHMLTSSGATGAIVGVPLGAVYASEPLIFNGVILTNTTCATSSCGGVIVTNITSGTGGRTAWGEQR